MTSVVALRTYYPGHLIYTEEAFARVLPRDKYDKECEFCGKSSEDLVACYDCLMVKYCGLECKSKDSSDHGIECPNMSKLRGDLTEDFVRLLGRIIFKIKDKEWATITRNVMGTEVSFEDIDPHYEEMTQNPKFSLLYKGLKEPLKQFIGEENVPEEEDLIKIIGKVKFSSSKFSCTLPNEFYFGMGRFEHECIPNSNLDLRNNSMKVWAMKKIETSEKVTVSYRIILTTDSMRSPINEDTLEVCKCTECTLPYGESVLTKIIDESKAYDAIRFSQKVIKTSQVLSNLDMESNSTLNLLVNKALQNHIGVLGNTNALHLKLLAIKAMVLEGDDVQKKMYLIEIEKHMKNAFGEYYLELYDIYKALVVITFNSGDFLEGSFYLKKLKLLEIHQSKAK